MRYNSVAQTTITNAGGTVNISLQSLHDIYVLRGTATLVAGFALATADTPKLGITLRIMYRAVVTTAGANTVSIFGTALSYQQSLRNQDITAYYNGSTWEVTVASDFSQAGIIQVGHLNADVYASSAEVILGAATDVIVNPATLAAWWAAMKLLAHTWALKQTYTLAPRFSSVTASQFLYADASKDLASTDLIEIITKEVSFETGEQGNNPIPIPFKGDIQSIKGYATKAIAGTDDGTITADIAGTPITTGVLTFAASSPLDTEETTTPTANFSVTAGQKVNLVAAKTTAGGRVYVVIAIKRTF